MKRTLRSFALAWVVAMFFLAQHTRAGDAIDETPESMVRFPSEARIAAPGDDETSPRRPNELPGVMPPQAKHRAYPYPKSTHYSHPTTGHYSSSKSKSYQGYRPGYKPGGYRYYPGYSARTSYHKRYGYGYGYYPRGLISMKGPYRMGGVKRYFYAPW
jgi:hypothetical protein